MKKSNANGDCKWQLSGRWELARCLFPNALCCPCIVWSVYLDGKKTWSDQRAHVMWSPSNSEWELDTFLTTLRTANYLCQMLSAAAGHCSCLSHFTLVYVSALAVSSSALREGAGIWLDAQGHQVTAVFSFCCFPVSFQFSTCYISVIPSFFFSFLLPG